MPQPVQTHINAFYADLQQAKREVAEAQQKVKELEDIIVARGGELPSDTVEAPAPTKEDTVQPSDVSATESFNNKKGNK